MKPTQKTFAIGIPTINRADLLSVALEKYREIPPKLYDGPWKGTMIGTQIFICDNGNQDKIQSGNGITVFKQEKNLGVARSLNLLCKEIFKEHEWALLLNDDIVFGEFDFSVVQWLESFDLDFACSAKHFSCVMLISKHTFETIGGFDENFFPAYFEDNDYLYRLRLAEYRVLPTEFLNPEVFRNSMSIEKEPELNSRFEENKKYYIEKWGGTPGNETFTIPFNKRHGEL